VANNLIQPALNNAACEAVIAGTHHGTLVMCVDNTPYAVPMNHAFVGGSFYFHCAVRGRKIDMLKQNPNVVYVVTKPHATADEMREDKRCHGPWESLLAYGTARVVEDRAGKATAYRAFMGCYGTENYTMTDRAHETTSMIVIEVASMTVRAELTQGKNEYWLWRPQPQPSADAGVAKTAEAQTRG